MQDSIIGQIIGLLLSNFTLTFFAIGLAVAAVSIAGHRPNKHGVFATLLNWFLFFAIGVTYIFNGFMHIAFGDFAAALIGWENNGFQAEVGFASIGFGIVGLIAFSRKMPYSLKFASLVGPTCFLWGAAATHIIDIVTTGNLSPNNAGVILYTDIFIPIIGLILWALAYRTGVDRTRTIGGDEHQTERDATVL